MVAETTRVGSYDSSKTCKAVHSLPHPWLTMHTSDPLLHGSVGIPALESEHCMYVREPPKV